MKTRRRRLNRAWFRATLTGLVVLAAACSGPDPAGDSIDALTDRLDARVPAAMEAYGLPGVSIALIDGCELVWSNAYGWADVAAQTPMTAQTVNRAESISKSVTAVGVMRLVEQGVVRLDDRLVDHVDRWDFPDDAPAAREITIHQLLSHTAGVAPGAVGVHDAPDGDMPSLEENLTAEFHLTQPPGSDFLYSNVGFDLLEVLIEDFADWRTLRDSSSRVGPAPTGRYLGRSSSRRPSSNFTRRVSTWADCSASPLMPTASAISSSRCPTAAGPSGMGGRATGG